ncbi:hypothetical protein [Qingshengfaniella alkalisoli]|uniref:DUF4168 domain-containing protein n=1 Tax=Qingshengfaniella alkalisoli TaxID=2599296 RepID=A0A5B8IVT8_9RHOB|nr:hypothetical protein [Qingshengfaniella alkalisoli]QDY69744.1 hypothetical protein FPZ52_09010 [Qingshengfaniella alkalisoli]
MLRKIVLATAITATALPTMVAAQEMSGKAQIAEILGVDGANFTLSELVELDQAVSMNDSETVTRILEENNSDLAAEQVIQGVTPESRQQIAVVYGQDYNVGKAQLAQEAGVEPQNFTLAQLVELNSAIDDNDEDAVQKVLDEAGVEQEAVTLLQ